MKPELYNDVARISRQGSIPVNACLLMTELFSSRLLALLAVCFLFSLAALGRQGPSPIMDPKSYASPLGEYVLEVDPGDLHGRGPAVYRFSHEGRPLWANELPFTLWEATVTDAGFVAGYAYAFGPDGMSEAGARAGPGEFHVVIMDRQGEFVLNEVVERTRSRFLHDAPNPLARGLIVDEANDRMVVRVREPDLNIRREWWRTYRISTGELRDKISQPAARQAKLVRGTPLVLAHYWRYARPDVGARFALVDPHGEEVWSKTLPRDYQVPGDREAEERLRDRIRRDGAVLDMETANEFEILSAANAETIRFRIERAAESGNDWNVEEVSRRQFQWVEPAPPELPNVPEEPLAYLGSFSFRPEFVEEVPISGVIDFDIDDRERIGFIRGHASDRLFRLVDENGEIVEEVLLEVPSTLGSVKVLWLRKDDWLLFASERGVGGRGFAWRIDAATREQVSLPDFESAAVEHVARTGDGGFIALARRQARYTSDAELTAFDEKGGTRWTITGSGSGNPVAGAQGVTVTGDGEIAVLDQSYKRIQFFDSDGQELRALDLAEAWGRGLIYLSALSGDGGNRLLVRSSGATGTTFVKMSVEGDVLAEFAPAFADGQPIQPVGGIKFSPAGAMWAGERQFFARLDKDGVEEITLGTKPGERGLMSVSRVAVDNRGTLFAVDARSGIVYGYDDEGRPQGIRFPDTEERDGDPGFGLEGTGVDFTAHGLDGVRGRWYRLPEGLLVVGYRETYILDAEKRLSRVIRRRPDNNWLAYPGRAAVASDGSFAIESGRRLHGESRWFANLYDADGEPLRAVEFSPLFRSGAICYNGDFLVTRTDSHVWLFDPEGAPLRKFALPGPHYTVFQATRDGTELWLIATGQRHVVRYALPSR